MPNTGHEWREPQRALRPGELLAVVGFWAFLAVFTAAERLLDPRIPSDARFAQGLVTLAFIEYTIWAALTFGIFTAVVRLGSFDRSTGARLVAFLGGGLLIAISVDLALRTFRHQLLGPPRFQASGVRAFLRLEFLDDFLIYVGILAAALARDYFLRYQSRVNETRELRTQLAEAQLTVLRAQINPHFLFNTLNAVSSLVEPDPRGARRMISRLGDLLRHSLEGTAEAEITLEREIDLLRRYLEIMEIRFQGALGVNIDVDPSLTHALVPNMILQPIVENAFQHGLAGMESGARLDVSASRHGDTMVLRVRDSGPGPAGGEPGIGTSNTRSRLAALYGRGAGFDLRAADEGNPGTVAEISLPWHLHPVRTAPLA